MLKFNAVSHTYTNEAGAVVPSVTQIMKSEGLGVPYQENPEAAAWGTTAHRIVSLVGEHTLGKYDPAFEPWMVGIRKFFFDYLPIGTFEQIVHYTKFGIEYAGMFDFAGMLQGPKSKHWGTLWVCDWKFWAAKSMPVIALAGVQTAGYAMAKNTNIHPRRMVVWFHQDGYEAIILDQQSDYGIWQGTVNNYYWKRRHLNG